MQYVSEISPNRKSSPTTVGLKQPTTPCEEMDTPCKEETVDTEVRSSYAIERDAFEKLVREIASNPEIQFQPEAMDMLQEMAEKHVESLFADAGLITKASNRTTVGVKDLKIAGRIRK